MGGYRRTERGAAAVEFAFIAPILLLLLFGIIGYGYMLSFRQAMSQAASEGARAAAVAPAGLPDTAPSADDSVQKRVLEAVNQGLGGYGVTCNSSGKLRWNSRDVGTCAITFDASCAGNTTGARCAKVELDYMYRDNSLLPSAPGLGFVLPANLEYTAEVEVS